MAATSGMTTAAMPVAPGRQSAEGLPPYPSQAEADAMVARATGQPLPEEAQAAAAPKTATTSSSSSSSGA